MCIDSLKIKMRAYDVCDGISARGISTIPHGAGPPPSTTMTSRSTKMPSTSSICAPTCSYPVGSLLCSIQVHVLRDSLRTVLPGQRTTCVDKKSYMKTQATHVRYHQGYRYEHSRHAGGYFTVFFDPEDSQERHARNIERQKKESEEYEKRLKELGASPLHQIPLLLAQGIYRNRDRGRKEGTRARGKAAAS